MLLHLFLHISLVFWCTCTLDRAKTQAHCTGTHVCCVIFINFNIIVISCVVPVLFVVVAMVVFCKHFHAAAKCNERMLKEKKTIWSIPTTSTTHHLRSSIVSRHFCVYCSIIIDRICTGICAVPTLNVSAGSWTVASMMMMMRRRWVGTMYISAKAITILISQLLK